MRIVIDLDGVICSLKKENETYSQVKPIEGVAEKISTLRKEGHYIIINTARHMLSTSNNIGLINKKIGKTTLQWLDDHNIEYDEILFAKPYGHVYIDDSAYHFTGWETISPSDFDTELLNIVIPMAGRGSRFADAGYEVPKPLIQIKGKPMFEWAAKTFSSITMKKRYIFIILREHAEKWNLDKEILKRYPDAEVIIIDDITRGQSETVLKAKEMIDNFNRLIIFNADTFSTIHHLEESIKDDKVDGSVACFTDQSGSDRYSFVAVDETNNILEAAEKRRISDFASNGLYYFKRGKDFVDAAEKMIETNETQKGEFYVMPIYNRLIKRGFRLKMIPVDENWILGTPDELEQFLQKYKD